MKLDIFRSFLLITLLALAMKSLSAADDPKPNYDESKIPPYTLPDPLVFADGKPVADADAWRGRRRSQIIDLFEENVYGKAPARPEDMTFETRSTDRDALAGAAIRKEVRILLGKKPSAPHIDVLIYLPKKHSGPAPVFLGLNFEGNHTIDADPGITLPDTWMPNNPGHGVMDHRASEKSRGVGAHQWQVETILARGYGLVTAYYGDIEPDRADGIHAGLGVRSYYLKEGQAKPEPNEWGAIAAWAWGLGRIMDYLETDHDIDAKHVAVMGHSRLGKTALWAGARDERFALVVSNCSGCGGASLARRRIGETVPRINSTFPHWFCDNFKNFNDRIDDLPTDQHMAMALVAPRPLYVASASEDHWADPHGEYLSARAATPVYRLLGAGGLPDGQWPGIEEPVVGTISYHLRDGKHDVTDYDWRQYLDCADRQFKK